MKNKQQLLIGLLIVLLVSNITTIVTILYLRNHSHKSESEAHSEYATYRNMPRGMYFKEELGLNEEQFEIFREYHQHYYRTARKIMSEMDKEREMMVDELGKPDSDSIKLQDIAVDIGRKHQLLKEMTIEYYLQMKENCNEEQKLLLNKLFKDLLNNDGNVILPTPGRQRDSLEKN